MNHMLNSRFILAAILVCVLAMVFFVLRRSQVNDEKPVLPDYLRDSLFWEVFSLCQRISEYEVDEQAAVDYLAQQEDEVIFRLHDNLSELLMMLNKPFYIRSFLKVNPGHDDEFLYARCSTLIHGMEFYERVLAGKERLIWRNESEGVLYVPMKAWAKKHGNSYEDYPHTPKNDNMFF